MVTRPMRVLICGGDKRTLDRIAGALSDEGVEVKTTMRLIDSLCFSRQEWDILVVDLDGLDSFLLSLLPAIRRRFSQLYMLGVSTQSVQELDFFYYGVKLDDYLFNLPRPEDLIVRLPTVAANYLCDTKPLAAPAVNP